MTKAQASNTARRRRINHALLVLVPLAGFTGLFSNTIGVDWWLDPTTVHGGVALAIVLLTPWKAPIVQRGLGRHRRSRWNSLVLVTPIAITLASGVLHSTGLTSRIGPLTVMQLHMVASLIALALIVFHYRSHPVPVRRTDLERRAFLRASGLGLAAATMS